MYVRGKYEWYVPGKYVCMWETLEEDALVFCEIYLRVKL